MRIDRSEYDIPSPCSFTGLDYLLVRKNIENIVVEMVENNKMKNFMQDTDEECYEDDSELEPEDSIEDISC